ncbi:MAG: glycoside hydrolase family 127 protein [Phycisphaerae bacterium]|nr:glycoside hydrolase family 127 protein [Phycisphaerae bacterium]
MQVLETLPSSGLSDFYINNRAPLGVNPLVKLPAGQIRPDGWLRHQLDLMARGMVGRLPEISPWCNLVTSAWADPRGEGQNPWEEMPYWLKGLVSLGFAIARPDIVEQARRWVNAILAGQRPDGYFGPEVNRQHGDLWSNMCVLFALRTWHEATSDPRILPAMTRYFRWMASIPPERLYSYAKFGYTCREWWQSIRGGDNLDSIYWLYNRTGESWLLELARVNHERTSDWVNGIASWHGVNICQCFREPAQYYRQSNDPAHLQATNRNYQEVMDAYGQVPGGMFGADENCREGYTGPRQAAETCSMVEFMFSSEMLVRITGKTLWADRCEDVAYNSFPASTGPDFMSLHYLTAPNMVQCDRADKSPMVENNGDTCSYSPYEQHRCCQHNVAFGWPYFLEHLWMATPGNGLAAVFYAPSELAVKVGDGTEIGVRETTDYPFGEEVQFQFSMPKPVSFPLTVRIPGWCEGARIRINNQNVDLPLKSGQWAVLDRNWNDGDKVELKLPMEIAIRGWEQNHNTISVDRGPLTYSLRIGERWVRYGDAGKWSSWEVFPTTPWNYALIVDPAHPAQSVEVVPADMPLHPQPFTPDHAPITIKVKGRKVPTWKQEANGLVGVEPQSPVKTQEPIENLTLIPMGCARLRISAFPHCKA